MPSNWTLETLPKPVDSRVVVRSVEPKRYIVSSFSGRNGANKIDDKVDEIRAYAASQKIETIGEPLMAFYNPPWTPPFLRRNEVMLELAQHDAE